MLHQVRVRHTRLWLWYTCW